MAPVYLKYKSRLPLHVCKSRLEQIDFYDTPFKREIERLLKIKYPTKPLFFLENEGKYYCFLSLGGGLFQMAWYGYLAEESHLTIFYLTGRITFATKFFGFVLPMSLGAVSILLGLWLGQDVNFMIIGLLILFMHPIKYFNSFSRMVSGLKVRIKTSLADDSKPKLDKF